MKKIRINELARELEVKPNKILELLPELGVQEKKTHSSSIDEDVAINIKQRLIQEGYVDSENGFSLHDREDQPNHETDEHDSAFEEQYEPPAPRSRDIPAPEKAATPAEAVKPVETPAPAEAAPAPSRPLHAPLRPPIGGSLGPREPLPPGSGLPPVPPTIATPPVTPRHVPPPAPAHPPTASQNPPPPPPTPASPAQPAQGGAAHPTSPAHPAAPAHSPGPGAPVVPGTPVPSATPAQPAPRTPQAPSQPTPGAAVPANCGRFCC